jgi:hypothetical protein
VGETEFHPTFAATAFPDPALSNSHQGDVSLFGLGAVSPSRPCISDKRTRAATVNTARSAPA